MQEFYLRDYDVNLKFPDGMSEKRIKGIIERDYPEPDEKLVARFENPDTPASSLSKVDHERYLQARPDMTAGRFAGMAADAFTSTAGRLLTNLPEFLKTFAMSPIEMGVSARTLAEGFARGTYDTETMGRMAEGYLMSKVEGFGGRTNDEKENQYRRFLKVKELQNVRSKIDQGDKSAWNEYMEWAGANGATIDPKKFNQGAAEFLGEFADPSLLIPGSKIGTTIAKATGRVTGGAVSAAGDMMSAGGRRLSDLRSSATDAVGNLASKVDEASGGIGRYAVPGGVGAAVGVGALDLGTAGMGTLAVAGIPAAMEVAGGLLRNFGDAMKVNPTRSGGLARMALNSPDTAAGYLAGKLQFLDTPVNYAGRAASGAVTGVGIGAGIGLATGGVEGVAQGIGSGGAMGAFGGTMGRFVEGATGAAKRAAQDSDLVTWLESKSDEDRASLGRYKNRDDLIRAMDLEQVILGSTSEAEPIIRYGNDETVVGQDAQGKDITLKGGGGAYTQEGGRPVIHLNTNSDLRTLAHETFHAIARIDGFEVMVQRIKDQVGKLYKDQEIDKLINDYEKSGKLLVTDDTPGKSDRDKKFNSILEEIGAEYFANYVKGKDSNYLFKGNPIREAIRGITDRFVAGKLDRVHDTFKSDIFKTPIKQSKALNRSIDDLVRARRRSKRNINLSVDTPARVYSDFDLKDDAIFQELVDMGAARVTATGKREMIKSKTQVKKIEAERTRTMAKVLDSVDDTGGLIRDERGNYSGLRFSRKQIDALLASDAITGTLRKALEKIKEMPDDSGLMNVLYAAATTKVKRGTRYQNLPLSNRDAILYNFIVSPETGTMRVKVVDKTLLDQRVAKEFANPETQKEFSNIEEMQRDLLAYLDALSSGQTPTAEVLGSAKKRDILNKVLRVRNQQNNILVPEGTKFNEVEKNFPWRDFRLDRIVQMQARETKVNFSENAHNRAKVNFRPRTFEPGQTRFSPLQQQTPEFKSWFDGSKVTDESGKPLVTYSGHGNVAMFGNKWQTSKATSGGFYFSEDPKIASSYAMGKMGNREYYEGGEEYRLLDKKGNPSKRLDSRDLTPAEQKRASRYLTKHAGQDPVKYWEENARYDAKASRALMSGGMRRLSNIHDFLEMMGETIAYDDYDPTGKLPRAFKQTKNTFEGMLDDLGIKWNSSQRSQPGVYPVYLSIKNPLDASKPFPQTVLRDLQKAAKRERVPKWKERENTQWTKDMPLAEFVEGIESGNEYWTTQVPTKAKKIFKDHGIDGIKELGMKGAEDGVRRQTNWIAFEPSQIKSATGNRGSFDPNKADIRFSPQRMNAEHAKAIDSGDTAVARKLVDDAANEAGFSVRVKRGDGKAFNRFDKSRRGESTKALSAKKAFFFTDSESAAGTFARMSSNNEAETVLRADQKGIQAKIDELQPQAFKDIEQALNDPQTDIEPYVREWGKKLLRKNTLHRIPLTVVSNSNFFNSPAVKEWYNASISRVDEQTPSWLAERERTKKKIGLSEDGVVREFFLNLNNYDVIDYGGETSRLGPTTYSDAIDKALAAGKDGVVFKNTEDAGEVINIYATFEPNQAKSADLATYDNEGNLIPLSQRFNKQSDDIRFSPQRELDSLGMFSKAQEAIEGMQQKRGTGQQFLKAMEKAGVKSEEIEDIGLDTFLKDNPRVNKEEVLDFIKANQIEMVEVSKAKVTALAPNDGASSYWIVDTERLDNSTTQGPFDTPEEALMAKDEILNEWVKEEASNYEIQLVKNLSESEKRNFDFDPDRLDEYVIKPYDLARINSTFTDKAMAEDALSTMLEEDFDGRYRVDLNENLPETTDYTRYSSYTEPGAEPDTYTERLLTLPKVDNSPPLMPDRYPDAQASRFGPYDSSHFDQSNIVSHVRHNDRIGIDGEKILFLEEIQSDWHQEGRKEGYYHKDRKNLIREYNDFFQKGDPRQIYKRWSESLVDFEKNQDLALAWQPENEREINAKARLVEKHKSTYQKMLEEGRELTAKINRMEELENTLDTMGETPNAPFKKSWPEFSMKRMLKLAADEGYDAIAWTRGDTQNARYQLGDKVTGIDVIDYGEGNYELMVRMPNEDVFKTVETNISKEKLPDYIGKELTQRALNNMEGSGEGMRNAVLEGENLRLGGKGMRGFYDDKLPKLKIWKQTKDGNGNRLKPVRKMISDDLEANYVALNDSVRKKISSQGMPRYSPEVKLNKTRDLNKRGGAIYTNERGDRAVQTSLRAGIRIYSTQGKRIGPVFQSIEKAERHLAKMGK